MTSYTGNNEYDLYENGQYDYYATPFQVNDTTYGGLLSLPILTTIAGYYGASITVEGSLSQIDLPDLNSFSPTYSGYSSLSVTQLATVVDPLLTTMNYVDVTLDGTGTIAVRPWQTLTGGSLDITGGDYAPTAGAATADNSFANLSNINGSSLLRLGRRQPQLAGRDFIYGQ